MLAAAVSRYQKDARNHGRIWFGDVTIPAVKVGRGWYFEEALVPEAIEGQRRTKEALQCAIASKRRATEDLGAGLLQGSDGDTIERDWGSYPIPSTSGAPPLRLRGGEAMARGTATPACALPPPTNRTTPSVTAAWTGRRAGATAR